MSDQWGVVSGHGYDVVQVVRTTEQCFFYLRDSGRETRGFINKLVTVLPTRQAAEKLREQLVSAKAECRRREAAARSWHANEVTRIVAKARGQS